MIYLTLYPIPFMILSFIAGILFTVLVRWLWKGITVFTGYFIHTDGELRLSHHVRQDEHGAPYEHE